MPSCNQRALLCQGASVCQHANVSRWRLSLSLRQSNHRKAIPAGCPLIILQPSLPGPAASVCPLWFLFPPCSWWVRGRGWLGWRGRKDVRLMQQPTRKRGSHFLCTSPVPGLVLLFLLSSVPPLGFLHISLIFQKLPLLLPS